MSSYRKKLIEVALPLDAINKESAREKSIRHGHPSTLHLWWARRPLAACRAVLFAQMVDDPSEYMPDEKSADKERERLFDLIEELVKWENINNEEVLDKARLEIAKSVARDLGEPAPVGREAVREFLATKAPPVLDPFAGGGSIPLEAQRLGLRAYASDLNPVAVLINKAMIEIPPKFANMPPVHPPENKEEQLSLMEKEWKGAEGLAEDVRYYGKWMRDEAERRIGHLYPRYKITQKLLDERPDLKSQGIKPEDELTVIAWLWARTVKCPNPACGCKMPLVKSFVLSKNKSNYSWIEPIVNTHQNEIQIKYKVKSGDNNQSFRTIDRNGAICLACQTPVSLDYIRFEAQSGRMVAQLMAIVTDSKGGRVFFSPSIDDEVLADSPKPMWYPDEELQGKCRVSVPLYGMNTFGDLFTKRQLVALNTFANLIEESHKTIEFHAQSSGIIQSKEYANSITLYLSFILDKLADLANSLTRWEPVAQCPRQLFARQAIPMVWDFAEGNPLGDSSGSWNILIENVIRGINSPSLRFERSSSGQAIQHDATKPFPWNNIVVSTDPPYYDNISYADLSDFFYIWLRKSLSNIFSKYFSTMLVPKKTELVATPYRFGGNKKIAEVFFEAGLLQVFNNINLSATHRFPFTVFYAFKQTEINYDEENSVSSGEQLISSTGWETMLSGLIDSGFMIQGTWPIRTEMGSRMVGQGTNALASSIILVCRPRDEKQATLTRRDFAILLKREFPKSLKQLQQGSIAPVDFAQAAIGPGMSIFSRYAKVIEADGSSMSVRTALALINQALDEFLAEQEGEYDTDTRWALAWYEQYGFNDGPYGVAETLTKAKNTSVNGLEEAGVLAARAGKVRLLSRDELKEDWDPTLDKRPTAWEAVQYLIRALDTQGEQAAAILLSRLGGLGETARDLAYRLYTICERKGWAQDALGYNMLVVAWPRLKELARSAQGPGQGRLL